MQLHAHSGVLSWILQAWGHSTAVGPFAEILATTDETPGIVYADLDLSQSVTRRQNMPLQARRPQCFRATCFELVRPRYHAGYQASFVMIVCPIRTVADKWWVAQVTLSCHALCNPLLPPSIGSTTALTPPPAGAATRRPLLLGR